VNKLLLLLAKVNGLVKYSATELVLVQFIAMRPAHSGIQQNAESTGIILNWDAIFFSEPPVFFNTSQIFVVIFSCFICVIRGLFPPPHTHLPSSENELERVGVECPFFDICREQRVILSASPARFLAPIQRC